MKRDTSDVINLRQNLLKAGLLAMAAAGFFAGMNLSAKALGHVQGPQLPAIEMTFFRFPFGLLTACSLLLLLLLLREPGVLTTSIPGAHLVRVLAGAGGVTMMFAALSSLPVGLVMAVGFSSPFFTLIFAVLILGEREGVRRWSAVAIGFLGVVIMTGLPVGTIEPAMGLAVAVAIWRRGEHDPKLFQSYFDLTSVGFKASTSLRSQRTSCSRNSILSFSFK